VTSTTPVRHDESDLKRQVRDFWQAGACGEVYAQGESLRERLDAQARTRYALEPYLAGFARFAEGRGKDVLEIGVGMGADHLEWARQAPRSLAGVDLTTQAIELTRARLGLHGLRSRLLTADAERLPFEAASFDLVYSWGVIHHSPDTAAAAREIRRVLRPGGHARVMIYKRASLVGGMLWMRYALLAGRPWLPLSEIYADHLESPGTKAYSIRESKALFRDFDSVSVRTALSPGDLLLGAAGQRHQGALLELARRVYPRWLARRLLGRLGLHLLIEATRRSGDQGES
jgi:SAM-dependent methyltransferase